MKKIIIIAGITLLIAVGVMFGYGKIKDWYEVRLVKQANLGALNLISNMSREFKNKGEIRFSPVVFNEDGGIEINAEGNPIRGGVRILIQKVNEFNIE